MVVASLMPSTVPFEIASRALEPMFCYRNTDFIVDLFGLWIEDFAITIAPGAAMTEAANKCLANSNRITGSSPPKNRCMLQVPTCYSCHTSNHDQRISDFVIRSKYALIMSGASV
ncbi:MAG: hypothetical protein CM15mP59_1420 [Flavobacteriaceae bacterium]|nr:MAG: hypothetical protein CM15mP59_1420 [Flavobacteriaceae bacterium]